jgi:hypothetical protein
MAFANYEGLYLKCKDIAGINKSLSDDYDDWVENTARDMEYFFSGDMEFIKDEPARTILQAGLTEIDWKSIAEDFCDEDEWEPEVEYTGEFDDDHDDILETDAT